MANECSPAPACIKSCGRGTDLYMTMRQRSPPSTRSSLVENFCVGSCFDVESGQKGLSTLAPSPRPLNTPPALFHVDASGLIVTSARMPATTPEENLGCDAGSKSNDRPVTVGPTERSK